MAQDSEPKARYPKQAVADGQEHGYIGDVEVYEPIGGGSSNVAGTKRTNKSASDSTPPEEIGVSPKGDTGTIKADDK